MKKQESVQTSDGTSIAIKNLFFNVPARRNFLKANPVEMRHIIDEFQRIALANPEIHFELHHNGMLVFGLPAANLRPRIVNVLGSHYMSGWFRWKKKPRSCASSDLSVNRNQQRKPAARVIRSESRCRHLYPNPVRRYRQKVWGSENGRIAQDCSW